MADCDGQLTQFHRAFTDQEDIRAEILTRLPVKSLMRFRCVCKPWRALIAQPYFATRHRSYADKGIAENNSCRLIFATKPLASVGLEELENFKDGHVVPRKLDFSVITPRYSVEKIKLVGSCDGLICVAVDSNQYILWNPCTRESTALPKPTSDWYPWFYGFGYDSTIDDYKVIRAGRTIIENGFTDPMMEVFTLKTGSWRICNDFNDDSLVGQGCLLNGVLHWLGLDLKIMSFHLGEEKFEEIPSPGKFFEGIWGIMTFRNCLCVFSGSMFSSRFSICMMKQYGVKESWTQVIEITPDIVPKLYNPTDYLRPMWILENGEILVEKVKKGLHLALYDPKDKELKNVIDHHHYYGFESVIYRETLVSPAIGANIIPSVSHM